MSAKVQQAFRLDGGLVDRLERVRGKKGLSKTQVVEAALRVYLPTVEGGGSRAGSSMTAAVDGRGSVQTSPPAVSVELVGWLSYRTGLPLAICRHKVLSGAVTVNGEPHTDLEIDRPKLGLVALDGEPV